MEFSVDLDGKHKISGNTDSSNHLINFEEIKNPTLTVNKLKSLDDLILLEDDDDSEILLKVESLKNFIRAKKKAKAAAQMSKYVEASASNDNSENAKALSAEENGALLNECDRKKVSLKLKEKSIAKSIDINDLEKKEQIERKEYAESKSERSGNEEKRFKRSTEGRSNRSTERSK